MHDRSDKTGLCQKMLITQTIKYGHEEIAFRVELKNQRLAIKIGGIAVKQVEAV